MALQQRLSSDLTPLPADYVFPDDTASQEIYEKMSPADRLNNGGKWWSMYDLMKFFHSGFLPENGETNFIRYEIDLTAPELTSSKSTDPNLPNEVNSNMLNGLNKLSSEIVTKLAEVKNQATNAAAAAATSGLGLAARIPVSGGGKNKKNKWGGDPTPPYGAPPPPYGAPPPPTDPGSQITALVSAENLEKECLNDLFSILFNSRNRIFITDSKPGTLGLVSTLNIPKHPSLTAPVAVPVPVIGGLRRRLHKTRKFGKKIIKMGKKHWKSRKH
jgi:hypothetical protein